MVGHPLPECGGGGQGERAVLGDSLLRYRLRAAGQRDGRQAEQQDRIVVRGHPVRALLTAAEAAVQDQLLAVAALDDADWRHQRAAVAAPVAGSLAVDVPRGEAHRAVIAMAAASDRRADEGPTAATLERLIGRGPWGAVLLGSDGLPTNILSA